MFVYKKKKKMKIRKKVQKEKCIEDLGWFEFIVVN